MKRMTAMASAAAVVLMAAGVLAQAKPNFAGTWTMDAPAAAAAPAAGAPAGGGGGGRGGGGRGGGGGWGMEITVTQTAAALNVKGMQGQNPLDLTYKLDGSESKNMAAGRGGAAPTEQISKAVWTGSTLVITTAVTTQAGAGEQKRVLSIAAGKLSIETTQPGGMPATVTYSKKM